ncbi:MAG: hypothetical protein IKX00_01265 [Bacilli bacterium]|nr:hypothetical protein [Bacilli bacterium]
MNKFLSLMKVNILGLIRGKERKKKKISHGIILILVGALFLYYAYRFAKLSMKGLVFIHSEYIILPEFFAISSILLIFINYKKINGLFFKSKDFDLLDAMPIKRSYIVISKMLELYLSALAVTCVFLLPAYYLYITNVSTDIAFHIYYFISLLFVPMIPVFVSTCIGYLISFVSSFFKRKDVVQLIGSILVIVGAYYLGLHSTNLNSSDYANFGKVILEVFNRYYPITIFYKNIVIDYDIPSLFFYILINVGLMALITFIITKSFAFINGRLHQAQTSRNKKIKDRKKLSRTGTLLKKDYKRLFSSTTYLLNTCTGVIITILLCIGFLKTKNGGVFGELINGTKAAKYIIPFMYSMFFGYIYPTAVSLSLEGKNFYILRVLPLSFKNIIKEKDIFHLSISIPMTLLAFFTIMYKLNMSMYTASLIYLFMLLVVFFYSKIHLLLDVIFLNITWENEVKLIKRSMQTIISLLISFSFMFIGAAMNLNSDLELLIIDIGVLMAIIITHIILVKFGTHKFNKTVG